MARGVIDLRKRKPGRTVREEKIRSLFAGSGRQSPLRARRRRMQALVGLTVAVFAGALLFAISEASYASGLSVQAVEIAGTKDVSPRAVRAYVETQLFNGARPFLSRSNMFLYPKNDISHAVVGYFPRVKTASVSRQSMLAQAITITIEEREPHATWCASAGDCYLMDETGYIFAAVKVEDAASYVRYTGELPKISDSPVGQTFRQKHIGTLADLVEMLKTEGFATVSIDVQGGEDFSVHIADSFDIRASFKNEPPDIVKNLQLVLSSDELRMEKNPIEYIDLRFGNRVYYKLKN